MSSKHYKPQPVDTSDVVLPKSLIDLGEQIARNVHEVWAASRMAQGWTYGPVRNDAARQHPGLVPYEALTETEKDYDRHTAFETLKLIVKLGFQLTQPNSQSTHEQV